MPNEWNNFSELGSAVNYGQYTNGGTVMQDLDTFGSKVGAIIQGITNAITGDTDYKRVLAQQGFQNAFEAQQAEIGRKWQEYMRDTNYQAMVQDMKKAGLNPYLAYGSSPSSTPSTSSPSGTGAQSMKSGTIIPALIGSLVNGAFDIARTGIVESAKSNRLAQKNAYETSKQSAHNSHQLHLANMNSRNAVDRDERWRKFYSDRDEERRISKNSGYLTSRKYTKAEIDRMWNDLKEDL